MSPSDPVREILSRTSLGQLVSTLTRVLGPANLDLAEDAVQEAVARALSHWARHGVPPNPDAWLTVTAKNAALDVLRRKASFTARSDAVLRAFTERAWSGAEFQKVFADDQLAMLFLCCHPALPLESQLALTLKTVCAFTTPEIARALLSEESAVAQRIVRAKRQIRDQNLRFELPGEGELHHRLDSALAVLYLMFNEGYSATGERLIREELCDEAIRLGRMTAAHPVTSSPDVHALVALMLLQSSRLAARTGPEGDLLTLDEQDRGRWDRSRILDGLRSLESGTAGATWGAYQYEAAIAAAHATAPSLRETDWPHILQLYDGLRAVKPSPVVELNRAVAVAKVHGPAAGLEALEAVRGHPALRSYYALPAIAGRLWSDAGDPGRAAEYYRQACELAPSGPEQAFCLARLAQLENR
ncbi:MAG: RNA polymerase subunit sigma-24 [Bryobacteraceae bacterium]|nr:RNA polymerase subunit sigma-24 [Bryobacteraceae bacterium]